MTTTYNKQIFLCFVEAWNSGDFEAMADFWSPEMVHHHRDGDYGRDDVQSLIAGFMAAFPDLRFSVEQLVAEDDLVTARMTVRATHQADFAGIPATGREVTATVMGMVRIADGHIVEHWNVMDELSLMQQLGLVPPAVLTAISSA
jgi:C-1 hydroxylase